MEREIAATRTGAGGSKGGVAQVETTGLIAAAYDHWDSRAGDPHLHTHVVVSNKVLTAGDRKWRSLDSRPLHAWTVALSELHQAVFADHLSRVLGVDWEPRSRGRDRNPDWAVASVPQTLAKKFSSRSADIDVATDHLIEQYAATHGHRPGRATLNKIRSRASLATRPAKQPHSLADLTTAWRERAHLAHRTVNAAAPDELRTHTWPMKNLGYSYALSEARSCIAALADTASNFDAAVDYEHALLYLDGVMPSGPARHPRIGTSRDVLLARAVAAIDELAGCGLERFHAELSIDMIYVARLADAAGMTSK